MSTPPKVCRRCRRPLARIVTNGSEFWDHHQQDQLADHAAEPVDSSEVSPIGRCDFCSADNPTYVLPVRSFMVAVGHMSDGDWSACQDCAKLIDANQWNALLERVRKRWEEKHRIPMPDIQVAAYRRLQRKIRAHITGSLRPIGD